MNIEEHKAFIEALVERTESIRAKLLRTERLYSRASGDSHLNDFASKLSPGEIELLAEIIEKERRKAFFDCLVELNERCALNDWKITKDGQEIPCEPFGYSMFEEYMTLLDDDRQWDALI